MRRVRPLGHMRHPGRWAHIPACQVHPDKNQLDPNVITISDYGGTNKDTALSTVANLNRYFRKLEFRIALMKDLLGFINQINENPRLTSWAERAAEISPAANISSP